MHKKGAVDAQKTSLKDTMNKTHQLKTMKFKKTSALLGVAFLSTISSHAASILASDPLNIPGLAAGQSFQLVFVTSTTVQADLIDGVDDGVDNSTIAQWNTYVNTRADASTLASASSTGGIAGLNWFAIVSVDIDATGPIAGTAAKDNAVVGASVYRTDGSFISTQANFYTASHSNPIKWNEFGAEQNTAGGSASGRQVWTGSNLDGTIDNLPLGFPGSTSSGIRMGDADASGATWIETSDALRRGPDSGGRVYALSEVITIIPEPSAALLTGLGALLLLRRRR